MSKIRVTRDSGYVDRIRKYKVICDSELIGEIGNGESLEFDVSPGQKEVFLKVDWCRSNKIRIDVPPDDTVSVVGGSNLRGSKLFLAIFYILYMPHKYLWINTQNS